ncbi:YlcI/YnfO family protein [Nocardia sp. NPDC051570]|uniref:YlcI/YnfO family protein n=1 Tax=Nocardia sp. NPDC051570 TaxID=3364324 RepID=UPI0037885A55
MPGEGRSVRVPDEVWDAAMARAKSEGRTVSSVIVDALERYVREGDPRAAQAHVAAQVRAAMQVLGGSLAMLDTVAATLESGDAAA